MKRFIALVTLFLYCTVGFADQTGTSTLIIGKPNSNDKRIIFNKSGNKPVIKMNNTTGVLQFSNDGTNFKDIGSGGGGAKNFVTNFDFEADTSGYATYKDTAATTPADGTGGSPTTLTLTKTTTVGEVLSQTGSLKVAKSAANSQGEGFAIDVVVDRGYLPGPASISFMYDATAANYATGDLVACLYNKDSAALIPVSGADVGLCKSLPKAKSIFKMTGNFSTDDDYRIIFHYSSTSALAYNLFFDEVNLNPLIQVDGVPASDYYTPVTNCTIRYGATLATNVTTTCYVKRVGDAMTLTVWGQFTGAANASGTMRVYLPDNLLVDSLKMSPRQSIGEAYFFDNSQSKDWAGTPKFDDLTTNKNYFVIRTDTVGGAVSEWAGNTTAGSNIPNAEAFTSSDQFWAVVEDIPIAQWSGSGNIVNGPHIEYACNTNSASDANDTTSFSNDPDGCLIPQVAFTADRNRQIRFLTAKQPGDKYTVEYRASNGYWQPLTNDFQSGLTLLILQAPTYYGFNIDRATTGLPATDLNLTFGRYAYANNSTFGGAGASWAAGGLVGYRYRVRKESGVAANAFAPATATSDGFVSPTTQTFGGAKTFNDVTTFKHTSGATTAGVYNTSSEWTFGTAGGAGGIKLPGPSGGTPALLNTYEEFSVSSGAFTEFSGTGTTGTASLRLVRVGKSVTGAIRFVVSGTAGSLTAFGLRDATGVWPSRFQPASLPDNFHIGYAAKGAPSGNKFYVGLTQSGGTNYLFLNKDGAFGNSEDTGWISFSYLMN